MKLYFYGAPRGRRQMNKSAIVVIVLKKSKVPSCSSMGISQTVVKSVGVTAVG